MATEIYRMFPKTIDTLWEEAEQLNLYEYETAQKKKIRTFYNKSR